VKPLEAEAILVFGRSMEAANLPTFLQLRNAKKSDICVIFAKKSWVNTKLQEGLGQNWEGAVPSPGTGLKLPLQHVGQRSKPLTFVHIFAK